jgi:hypothetical protein
MKTLLVLALLLPAAALAQTPPPAPKPAADPAGPVIKCSDWRKTPDGDWKSGPDTTVTYGAQHLTFKGERVEEGGYTIGGEDLYALLNQTCGG